MNILIPKQHGAWAMLVIPFVLGMLSGEPALWHLFLFFGWLFLYLATYPFVLYIRKKRPIHLKWTLIYGGLAILCLLPILYIKWTMIYFGIAMLPFFFINIYFAKKNKERAFLNDVAAIMAFCIGGLASYYLGTGILGKSMWFIFAHSFLFFLGCTFYVKTMIREKKNTLFKYLSWGYHILLPVVLFVTEGSWLAFVYIPSMIRAIVLYGRKLSIMQVGIIEILNSIVFLVLMIIYIL